MRYALIMAGGSGTRLWPMSTRNQPKQLIPFLNGRSLLEEAFYRLNGLIDADKRCICAGETHRELIRSRISDMQEENYIGEPVGRDTLNALALSSAVIKKRDPEAVIGVFTADHIIEPVPDFIKIVENGFSIVESNPDTLLTFGITPDTPATGFGYLELGSPISGNARRVSRFKEKPDQATARQYTEAGPEAYLWNSGMFIWRADTFLDCVSRFEPEIFREIEKLADSWGTPDFQEMIGAVYPCLKKISVDFAIMEPASLDDQVQVAALPMPLRWIDIGSWTAYFDLYKDGAEGNTVASGDAELADSRNCFVSSSEDGHVIAGLGCEDLIIVHTPKATLVCRKDRAQDIKDLHTRIRETYGDEYV
jgi:mannose-1-phosphate guanylyltransferase